MPSLYTSTTSASKLKFCREFFAQHPDVTLATLKSLPPFRKVDMYDYFKKLIVRSLRSKRSSMVAIVNVLKNCHPVFATMFPMIECEFFEKHPRQRPNIKIVHAPKPTTKKKPQSHQKQIVVTVDSDIIAAKKKVCEQSTQKRRRSQAIKTPNTNKTRTKPKRNTATTTTTPTDRGKKIASLLYTHDICYSKKKPMSEAATIQIPTLYVDVDETLQKEYEHLLIEIQSLELAIDYAEQRGHKSREACILCTLC